MKKFFKSKILICFLCTFIFVSSVDVKKSHAMDVFITPAMAVTILTVAAASGIVISNSDSANNILNAFYTKHKKNQEEIKNVFNACVGIGVNKITSVGEEFLDYCKSAFESLLNFETVDDTITVKPFNPSNSYHINNAGVSGKNTLDIPLGVIAKVGKKIGPAYLTAFYSSPYHYVGIGILADGVMTRTCWSVTGYDHYLNFKATSTSGVYTFSVDNKTPSADTFKVIGTIIGDKYNWDKNISAYVNDGALKVYTPASSDSLYNRIDGIVATGTNSPPYELPKDGVVSLPGVSNPSWDIGKDYAGEGTITYNPALDVPTDVPVDTPVDTPWAGVTDWVTSLVVPSDTYWIDKFNHFRNLFLGKFPGVDMDPLNKIACGENPFPNIDVELMGTKSSRILDSDRTINDVVMFFRPLVQGFISIFLLLYAYKEVYFLIRGTKPFDSGKAGGVIQ